MRISAPNRASVQKEEVWDLGYGSRVDTRRRAVAGRFFVLFDLGRKLSWCVAIPVSGGQRSECCTAQIILRGCNLTKQDLAGVSSFEFHVSSFRFGAQGQLDYR